MKCKQIELDKAATECRSKHCLNIIRIYSAEMESSTKAVHLSGEIIQSTYYLMSAHLLLTDEMEQKMNQLSKIHDGQRGVRFTSDDVHDRHENDDDDLSHAQNIDDITLETRFDLMDSDGDEAIFAMPPAPPNHAKRALNIDEAEILQPKRFASTSSNALNATQVLDTHVVDDENGHAVRPVVTVAKLKPSTTIGKRPMPTSRALKETNINVNKEYVAGKNGVVKALVNGKPVALKEKENKRFVTTVGKSPRRNSPSASSKSKFQSLLLLVDVVSN